MEEITGLPHCCQLQANGKYNMGPGGEVPGIRPWRTFYWSR